VREFPGTAVPRRASDLAQVEGDQRVAMLDLAHLGRVPVVLEGPAAAVWSLVDGARTVEEIVDELGRRYDASREVVSADVMTFLGQLLDRQLLVLQDGSPT
jgi:hypothetical protein